MVSDTALEAWTLRKRLEHQRLVQRMGRLERVVAALEQRADTHALRADVPAPLRMALEDFRRELLKVRRQLAQADDNLQHLTPSRA